MEAAEDDASEVELALSKRTERREHIPQQGHETTGSHIQPKGYKPRSHRHGVKIQYVVPWKILLNL